MEGWKIHDGSHLHPMLASDVVEVDLWNADLSSIFLSFFEPLFFVASILTLRLREVMHIQIHGRT